MAITRKKVLIALAIFFVVWQFWTDPLGLADTVNAAFGILGAFWHKFTIFMGALGEQ